MLHWPCVSAIPLQAMCFFPVQCVSKEVLVEVCIYMFYRALALYVRFKTK